MNRRDLITAALATFVSAQTSARVQARPRFATDPFTLGVASGDPSSDGFVLWTRLVGPALSLLDEKAVAVNWEVAADDAFKSIVRRGASTAIAERAHAVHIELHGLEPGRPYWYRFHTGNAVSRIGRTMTAPIAADRFTFAVVSCQHWEQGWFSGYRDILSSSAQAIVHVGDYIYEESFGHGPLVRSFGAPMPTDLAGYRLRHALYKTDAHLQEAHAATPWIVTWDDHEVQNDYAGVHPGDSDDVEHFIPRRRAAYQAYFEHMPLRPSTFRNGAVQMHRRLRWGDLAMLHVLDARQYRDDQPCGTDKEFGGRRIELCDEARDPRRSMLGAEQEAWLYAGLRDDVAPWSLILQQTLFSELNLSDTATPAYWSDIWDGYAANRQRLLC